MNQKKHVRQRVLAKQYLKEKGPCNTKDILDYINQNLKKGTTKNSLCQILKNDKDVIHGPRKSRDELVVWGLRE